MLTSPLPPRRRDRIAAPLLAAAAVLAAVATAAADARYNAVGPPLDPIATKLADRRWLVAFLLDPGRLMPGTSMPKSDLTSAEAADIAAFLYGLKPKTAAPAKNPATAGDAAAGERLFVERGCRGCHAVAPGERSLGPNLSGVGRKATRLWLEAWIRAPRAYHAATPMPAIDLSDGERGDLVAYLGTLQAGADVLAEVDRIPAGNAARGRALVAKYECNSCHQVADLPRPAPALAVPESPLAGEQALDAGRALVEWYRCRGCHVIEGEGGRLREHLTGETLAPPRLDDEGARVQPVWLVRYLRRPDVLRSWLRVRMPDYGLQEKEATALAAYFAALAAKPFADEPRGDTPAHVVEAGRRNFEAYRCAQCHPAAGEGGEIPLDDRAIDLRLARDRLRPSWIARFLRQPAAVAGPQTRMPAVFFAADGRPNVPDAAAQVEAVSAFLLRMDEPAPARAAPRPTAVDWSRVEY